MDPNQMAAAGFYYTNTRDVVCCAFCEVGIGHWEKTDNPITEHQRWSPSCDFIKGLFVGNIPILSNNQPETSSQHTASVSHMEYRPNSRPERGKYNYFYFIFIFS